MTEAEEEWEEKIAPDGTKWFVLKNPSPPTPPLGVTEAESKALDAVIRSMTRRLGRENLQIGSPRRDIENHEWIRKAIDKVLAEGLTSLKIDVPNDPAEKLFDRLGKVSTDWGDDADAVGILFYRYFDTMEAMVSYKRKFRGKTLKHLKYTKEEALKILRERGLTRR